MGLLKQNQQKYYGAEKSFTGDGTTLIFTISTTANLFPTSYSGIGVTNKSTSVYIDGALYAQSFLDVGNVLNINYDFNYTLTDGWHLLFATAPTGNISLKVKKPSHHVQESYQFTSLKNIINNFVIAYTGEDKIIPKANRTDIQFHAMRALQELSFDTFKSTKSQEIEVPASLRMKLPHDYVNYVKITSLSTGGVEQVLYPAINSSDPSAIKQDADGNYSFDINDDGINDTNELINPENSDTWNSYKSASSENTSSIFTDGDFSTGDKRYGLDPKNAQTNGSFYINDAEGYIHFSSNISGTTITLKYISDSLGTDEEMQVHKFAEEAVYKHIMYGMLSTRMNIPEYVVQRYKKERFAETRKAKLRLSNIKLEEITQILRGKSKIIKH